MFAASPEAKERSQDGGKPGHPGKRLSGAASWTRIEQLRDQGLSAYNAAISVESVERKGFTYLTDAAGAKAMGQLIGWAMVQGWTVTVDTDFDQGGMIKVEDPEHPARGQS